MDGLIIKKKWLDLIFKGKWMEIRSTDTKKRGRIALIESGSGKIVGDAYITYTMKFSNDNNFKACKDMHFVSGNMMYKNTWTWCFDMHSIYRYEEQIPYKHPQGAVIWVRNVL